MADVRYWIADMGGPFATSRTVLCSGGGKGLRRYNYATRTWDDEQHMNLGSGSPEVEEMTAAEAEERIKEHGGSWVDPPEVAE
jgi:hypothetical protein